MSGISSGVGLISGLPTSDLIDQLMQIQHRPIDLLQGRVSNIQTERTAWADLSARLLAVQSAVSAFGQISFFRNFSAVSSDETVLTAIAGEKAVAGTHAFTVQSLVSNHQLLSDGFADADTTPVGAGELSIEIGGGGVQPDTALDQLHGGAGVRRGTIRITDRTGAGTDLDLTTAFRLDDVLERINAQSAVNVSARVENDRLVVEDHTLPEQVVGDLSIADVGGGQMAADLGLVQTASDGRIDGTDLVYLTDGTSLAALNDGNGVRHHVVGGDFQITQANLHSFEVSLSADLAQAPTTRLSRLNNGEGVRLGVVRITDRSGASAEVDLSGAETSQDVLDALNGSGLGISATVGRDYFQINDTTATPDEQAVNLKIEDVSGYTAHDLGIAFDEADSSFVGSTVFRITTIGDVIRAINEADGNLGPGPRAVASISEDGNGITLVDESIDAGPLKVEALEQNGVVSQAAADLGILGEFASKTTVRRDLIAGPNTVLLTSLNGGRGIASAGAVEFTARDGTATTIDFTGAQTLQEVIDRINATSESSKVSASVNAVGNGLQIADLSGGGGTLEIADVGSGTTAADLGLTGTYAAEEANGGNLQLRYVSENSRLEDLNYGGGIRPGRFQITDSAGIISVINVTENQKTLADIIGLINAGPANVTARINDQGDGLLLTDEAGESGRLSVIGLDGSSTAEDLNLVGEASEGDNTLDGSYEVHVEVDADDTLNDIVSKINLATEQVRASVLDDGSANGSRLTLTSQVSGRRGAVLFDAGDTGLSMETLVRAQDAVVFLGEPGAENPLVITSSSNTLDGVLPGVTLDLVGTSDQPVNLSVTQDIDAVLSALNSFVTNYNSVLDQIDTYTDFNSETFERGVLLGDSTVQRVQSRLFGAVTRTYENVPANAAHLFDIGLEIGSGGRLKFDETKFREAYQNDPTAVEQLFTTEETGVGDYLKGVLDEMTSTDGGLITRADDLLENNQQLLEDRIESLQVLLDKKRTRLESEFAGLEESLAALQGQQNALTSLSSLVNSA